MKIQTPMQTLRDHLKNFDLLTEQFNLTRKKFQHRKSKSAMYPYEDKKAIHSDFLMVFYLDTLGKEDSFGFKFTYLDTKKKEVIKEQYFEINFKINGEIYNSKVFSIQEAKSVFKFINHSIKENNFDKISFFEFLKTNFMISDKELKDNYELFEAEFNKESKYLQKELTFQEVNSNTLYRVIRKKEVELHEFVNELEETIQIEMLELRIKQLRSIVNQKKLEKYNKLEIKKYKDLLERSKSKIDIVIEDINRLIMKINKKFNIKSSIVNKFKNKFSKNDEF
tara:strand:- start:16368 stop:17210 length:843 start_codon:yes stop_codon:yes gene_type:complete